MLSKLQSKRLACALARLGGKGSDEGKSNLPRMVCWIVNYKQKAVLQRAWQRLQWQHHVSTGIRATSPKARGSPRAKHFQSTTAKAES